jgi:hypothetical protein
MSGTIDFVGTGYKATLRTPRVIVSVFDVSREKALARALNDIGYPN